MASESIPPDVVNFICAYIDSVEQLSVLLLLNENPKKIWTTTEISKELRSTETSIDQRLKGLYKRKILEPVAGSPTQHLFALSNDKIHSIVNAVSEQYRLKPHRVMEMIYSNPTRNMIEFADAFKLRGDK